MENFFGMIVNAENLRTLVLLVAIICGGVWLRADLRKEIAALDVKINSLERTFEGKFAALEKSIEKLKTNDLAHLNEAIRALTFTLMKNGKLEAADKDFVDSHLDR